MGPRSTGNLLTRSVLMLDQNSAIEIMKESIDSLARSGTIKNLIELSPLTQLLGPNSPLDSLGFVTFVTDLEDRMQVKLNRECYLSFNEIIEFNVNSPSLTVDILAQYLVKLAAD